MALIPIETDTEVLGKGRSSADNVRILNENLEYLDSKGGGDGSTVPPHTHVMDDITDLIRFHAFMGGTEIAHDVKFYGTIATANAVGSWTVNYRDVGFGTILNIQVTAYSTPDTPKFAFVHSGYNNSTASGTLVKSANLAADPAPTSAFEGTSGNVYVMVFGF